MSKNINQEKIDEVKDLGFVQMWESSRKAGIIYYTLTYGLYSFIVYLFLKMLYCLYIKDFNFTVDWWAIIICIAFGPSFYYIMETIYKKKKSS